MLINVYVEIETIESEGKGEREKVQIIKSNQTNVLASRQIMLVANLDWMPHIISFLFVACTALKPPN